MLFKNKTEDVEKLIKNSKKYNPSFSKGLTSSQVKERIESGLVNKQRKTVTKSYLEIIVKNIFTLLNLVLLAVAIVMCIFGLYQRLFFLLILLLNIGISLFQDIKARKLVGQLSLLSRPKALVVRDGKETEIPFNELVLSDIFILKAGNTIPTDALIVKGEVRINESFLSGETEDVIKKTGDKIYGEAIITSGFAYARVEKVGSANYASKLQEKAKTFSRPKSEILSSLTGIIRIISLAAIALGIAEIITYSLMGRETINSVDSITSSIVAMIPIGMYLMTSITLTVGVIILARHRILVRELYSIEMLARVNVLCLDKTGTLTDGNIIVESLYSLYPYKKKQIEDKISKLLFVTKDDNLTAKALKKAYNIKPIKGDYSLIPFSSDRKYSAASFDNHTYVLGALNFVEIKNDKAIRNKVNKLEELGRRVLIIAEGKGSIKDNKLPNGLKAIGIIVMKESIKKDAKKNIEWFIKNDVAIRIISGDSLLSIQGIAKEIGLKDYKKAVSLEGLSDDEVIKAVHRNVIFARVTPDQKQLIISELRNMGNSVAMVGDGVNDLLALKSADCSIAMANGSDAIKAVSHLVSLDSNFSSLPKVVGEGRRVINNLQRVCSIFLVKTIFAITTTFIFLFLSWVNKDISYPFRTNHLFVWEFLTIGIAPFFVALEPNRERIKGGFIKNIISEAVPGAIAQLVITFPLLFANFINPTLFPDEAIICMCVVLLSVMSLVILLHVCMPINRYRGYVLLGSLIVMILFFVGDVFLSLYTSGHILDINYLSVNNGSLLLGIIMFAITVPLYFLVARLFSKPIKKKKL